MAWALWNHDIATQLLFPGRLVALALLALTPISVAIQVPAWPEALEVSGCRRIWASRLDVITYNHLPDAVICCAREKRISAEAPFGSGPGDWSG